MWRFSLNIDVYKRNQSQLAYDLCAARQIAGFTCCLRPRCLSARDFDFVIIFGSGGLSNWPNMITLSNLSPSERIGFCYYYASFPLQKHV